jgi:DNA-directed RNA polymerase subunit delta
MSNLSDRVSFIQGLAEGMQFKDDTNAGKLLLKMLDVLADMAKEIEDLTESQEELNEYVESIDDDLAEMEESLFGEEEDACCGCGHDHGDNESDDDDDDDDDDEELVEYTCPNCGHVMSFEVDAFDFDEENLCPECHSPLFPETTEEKSTEE